MDGAGLSQRERAILAGIEEQLRTDALLDRRLRTMRPGLPFTEAPGLLRGRLLTLGTGLGGAMTAVLLVMAASSSSPALIWAFAATWVLTLSGLSLLLCRWSRRLAAGHLGTDRPDGDAQD
ncbi:hypothetical protein QFZ82_007022 [Streptomyces sp. V4I23]|uniref:hypothetical protein n=1 Tax=Streptomyces sp. V4I23 TaxID=3042282 RepID=UPI00278A1192|nr:hypothetical protein [Streptomyces sp. V4I23]MDQ1012537.1 hypothetical protein [Streptomyces sp. V4I23]